jgi:hypothetical protein
MNGFKNPYKEDITDAGDCQINYGGYKVDKIGRLLPQTSF